MRQAGVDAKRHLVLLLLLTASFWGQAQPAAIRQSLMQEIAQDVGAEDELRHVLGKHYARFERNFEVAANPVRLRDGGVFLDGWHAGHPDTHAAAMVLYEDGRVYAAYFEQDGRQIRSWMGGSDTRRHPALQVWLQRLHKDNLERTSPLSRGAPVSGNDAPSPADQEELRKIATSIWGNTAADWE